MSIITTPNMSLTMPVVGQELGPAYATDVNNCLITVDKHNHTPGSGVFITPAAININSNLPFANYSATLLQSATFTPQPSPLAATLPNLGSVYVAGVDLYYNDVNGNQVRITQGGSVTGATGSITGLTSPASASYQSGSGTFVWQSNTNTSASMDNGPITIRNNTSGSNGVTVNPPTSIPTSYSMTLPPNNTTGTTAFLTYTTANQMQDTVAYPLQQTALAPRASGSTVGIGGIATSSQVSTFSTTSSSPVNVTGLTCTITTNGRPVMLLLQSYGTNSADFGIINTGTTQTTLSANFTILNGATPVCYQQATVTSQNGQFLNGDQLFIPVSVSQLDMTVNGTPGTYTYQVQLNINMGGGVYTAYLNRTQLIAYEI